MINSMRKMAPAIMLVILVAFVGGTIFLDWGMNAAGMGRPTIAGKINDTEISLQQFDHMVNQERQRIQQQQGTVPPAMYQQIPAQVWEQEVQRVLMREAFRQMRLESTAEELFHYIKNNPFPGIEQEPHFQTEDGVFDTSKYIDFLSDPRSYDQFPFLRDMERHTAEFVIPAQKFETLLQASVLPSPSEIEQQYRLQNEKAVFEYVKVRKSMFDVDQSDITEEMIQQYYRANRRNMTQDEKVNLRFARIPIEVTEYDEAVYRNEMEDLRERILSDEFTFEKEAEFESDDEQTAPMGGYLGWFAFEQMVSEFSEAAFSLEVGEISEPVRTAYGYHLIQVEGKEERDGELMVNARHILRNVEPTIETIDRASDLAESLREEIIRDGFDKVVENFESVQVGSTGLFARGDNVPEIGFLSGLMAFAFDADIGGISDILENPDAVYVLSVKEKVPSGIIPLEVARQDIVITLKDSLQNQQARNHAAAVLATVADTEHSLVDLQQEDPLLVSGATDTVGRLEFIPVLGFNSKAAAVAFSLDEGQMSGLVEDEEGFYFVKTKWISRIDTDQIPSQNLESVKNTLKQQRMQMTFSEWMTDLKENAKIVNNVDRIYMQ